MTLYRFGNLAQFEECILDLPFTQIIWDMREERRVTSLKPLPIDWDASTREAPYTFNIGNPSLEEMASRRASFYEVLQNSDWRDLTPQTGVGWSTRDYVGHIIITPTIDYDWTDQNHLLPLESTTVTWLNEPSIWRLPDPLKLNCYYIHTETDIWLAQVELFASRLQNPDNKFWAVDEIEVYRREVSTEVAYGNSWFYNQNRPEISWRRYGGGGDGLYGGEIISMPKDWERGSPSMKPLQAQFHTLGDFVEVKLKYIPWIGRTPDGGLTSYIDSIRSNDSPFMIPLPFGTIKGRMSSIRDPQWILNNLGGSNHWPFMYVLGSEPKLLNYPQDGSFLANVYKG